MPFVYEYLKKIALTDTITRNGRVYHTPYGDFPSVTNVLGRKLDNKKLDAWKKRVGEEQAELISQQARTRGTEVHSICEKYLRGDDAYLMGTMPSNREMALRACPILDTNITKIYGIELPLCSPTLKTAGRTDGVVEWNHRNAILDFKTARTTLNKTDDRIGKYNLQATTYAMMVEEMYGVEIPYNVIMVFPADHSDIQVIIKTNEKYRPIVRKVFS